MIAKNVSQIQNKSLSEELQLLLREFTEKGKKIAKAYSDLQDFKQLKIRIEQTAKHEGLGQYEITLLMREALTGIVSKNQLTKMLPLKEVPKNVMVKNQLGKVTDNNHMENTSGQTLELDDPIEKPQEDPVGPLQEATYMVDNTTPIAESHNEERIKELEDQIKTLQESKPKQDSITEVKIPANEWMKALINRAIKRKESYIKCRVENGIAQLPRVKT